MTTMTRRLDTPELRALRDAKTAQRVETYKLLQQLNRVINAPLEEHLGALAEEIAADKK